jgi:hypothetical protein
LGGQRCTRFLEKFRIYCFVLDGEGVDGLGTIYGGDGSYRILELHEFYNKIRMPFLMAEVYNPAEYRIIFD